ncbi:MAG: efflux RND transporter periplasmic adaptor subunit [Acidobacteria bacterium]|nr:efflux RND transporter periplasmic adaptor subunit [Acidobacteriota bacterium]
MKMQKSLVVSLLAATLLVACGGTKVAVDTNANAADAPVDVTTAPAIVEQIPTYFEATGNLASDEATDVAPNIAGKIVEVNFDVGSYVEKGSVLVRLDQGDARIRIEQAEAAVAQAQRNEGTAIAAVRQAQVRLGVKDGESFDIETFSQVKSVRANLALAERELARSERLLESGDVSRSAVDQRRATRDALLGQLDEARSNAAVAVKAISSAQAQAAAARAAVVSAQAQLDQAKKSLADTVIYAPISGYISDRIADPGEYISPSAPNAKIATIVRTSTLRMRIDVPEQSIGKVAEGQGISLQVSAYPDRNFAGTVTRILPSLNAQARTMTVEADVPNTDGLLKPGQFATVRITQSAPTNAVMVPKSAVRTEGDVSRVFVIKDGAAHERLVQLGTEENDLIQIKQNLTEGESVATSNVGSLYDGVLVRVSGP